MPHPVNEPTISPLDAEELCADPYPTVTDALIVAKQLRTAGWVVVEHRSAGPRARPGARMVASVYHPATFESPGDLRVSAPDP